VNFSLLSQNQNSAQNKNNANSQLLKFYLSMHIEQMRSHYHQQSTMLEISHTQNQKQEHKLFYLMDETTVPADQQYNPN
jgi:hypothetical protein